ncbi:MAG: SRPBCC domain-containing protein [Myxococcales bacterium]|nr:SRPBCC domain-containing protein [Myxococcales bacterium]
MTEHRLEIRRVLRATPERVYAAWAEREQWRQWFGAGAAASGARSDVELDPRVGGLWQATMARPQGPSRVRGVFHDVTAPRRLVFTWQWDETGSKAQLVSVTIDPHEEGLGFDPPS